MGSWLLVNRRIKCVAIRDILHKPKQSITRAPHPSWSHTRRSFQMFPCAVINILCSSQTSMFKIQGNVPWQGEQFSLAFFFLSSDSQDSCLADCQPGGRRAPGGITERGIDRGAESGRHRALQERQGEGARDHQRVLQRWEVLKCKYHLTVGSWVCVYMSNTFVVLLIPGIDVEQVSLVVNFDLPMDMYGNAHNETYLHRIGRTGRFGRRGYAVSMVDCEHSMDIINQIEMHFSTFLFLSVWHVKGTVHHKIKKYWFSLLPVVLFISIYSFAKVF